MKPIKITATKVDLENNSIVIYFDEESAVDSLTNDQKFAALSAHIQAIRKYEEDADTPTRYGKSQVGNYEPTDKPNWLERYPNIFAALGITLCGILAWAACELLTK